MCNTHNTLPCIDGCYDETSITEKFKNYFEQTCKVNSEEHNLNMKTAFSAKLNSYSEFISNDLTERDFF